MSLIDLSSKFSKIKEIVENVHFTDVKLTEKFKFEYELYLRENRPNGFAKVDWAEFSTKITTTTNKVIFITNFWFYIASELSNYLDGLLQHKELFRDLYKDDDLQKVATSLRNGVAEQEKNRIESYFTSKKFSKEDLDSFLSFVSDYPSWGGGKTIDRNDYYVSPLLQAGNLLAETQSAIAEIAKQFSENPKLKNAFSPIFITKKCSMQKPLIDADSRSGFAYSLIEFLIQNKIQKPLFDCLIEKNREQGNFNIEYENYRLTTIFKVSDKELETTSLEYANKIRFFEKPFKVNSKHYYLSNQWTDGTDSRLDISTLKAIFHSLYSDFEIKTLDNRFLLLKRIKKNSFNDVKASKPFLLLAGLSGTGKTRFVREQANYSGQFNETYCLTSVRPDWHEPSDLLGYISRLNGSAEYITTDVLQFIAKAWRGIANNGLTIDVQDVEGHGERLVVAGNRDALNQVLPYWLCLDEMNLAPVEQYFADYLSVLETREWCWENDSFTYTCDALLKPATIQEVADKNKLRRELGFEDSQYDELWDLICQYGLSIPFNLMVAGTVNMDETTHGFSRKVIDRALSFDFGAFFPNYYDAFFVPTSCNKQFSYPIWSQAKQSDLTNTCDTDGSKTVAFLTAVNTVLKNTPFELAYRALNELLLAVVSNNPQDDLTLKAVWDDFLMCKVLPRIEGDNDKLTTLNSSGDKKEILAELNNILATQLAPIWDADEQDVSNQRPDLYREKKEGETDDTKIIRIPCRSKDKLTWMQQRLTSATFTSFWP